MTYNGAIAILCSAKKDG